MSTVRLRIVTKYDWASLRYGKAWLTQRRKDAKQIQEYKIMMDDASLVLLHF